MLNVGSDVGSPRPAQQTVKFTAAALGGVAPAEFKWLVNGAVTQNWSTSTTYSWTPATAGVYSLNVWARSAGATADAAEASSTFTFTITEPTVLWMTGVWYGNVTYSKSASGSTWSLSWSGEGGTPPYQYRVESRAGNEATFQLLRDWSSATSIDKTWTVAGTHYVRVWGRSAGSTSATGEVSNTLSATVEEPVFAAPPTSLTLTANKPSPQRVGTTIEFDSVATGPATYEYQFQYQLGANPPTGAGWGSVGRTVWTPTVAGTYTITVFARQWKGGDATQVSRSMVFVVTP